MSKTTDLVIEIESTKAQAKEVLERMLDDYNPKDVLEMMQKLEDSTYLQKDMEENYATDN